MGCQVAAKGYGAVAAIVVAVIGAVGLIGAALITTFGDDRAPDPPTSPPTPPPSIERALADLSAVEGGPLIDTSPQTVNGTERTRPIVFELGCFEGPQMVTYQLGRQYARFTAVVGQSDLSTEEDPVLFEVVVDDVTLFSEEVGIGEEEPVEIDLGAAPDGGVSMTIQVSGNKNCDAQQIAVWSGAVLQP